MRDHFTNYYKVINAYRSDSQRQIRRSYLKLAKKFHPDKHINNKADYTEKMKAINAAYGILGDENKRNRYNSLFDEYYRNRSEEPTLTRKPTYVNAAREFFSFMWKGLFPVAVVILIVFIIIDRFNPDFIVFNPPEATPIPIETEKNIDFICAGLTQKSVLRIMGNPDSVREIYHLETWYYGQSTINFNSDSLVRSWDNQDNNLRLE